MPEVWFIRHGESISNANLPTEHPAQSPLTARGVREAALVPHAFAGRKPSLVVSSSYVRTQQTAVPTLTHFDPIAHEMWPVHEFTYLAPARYNGTTSDDRRPFAQAYWQRSDPLENEGGAGESFSQCLARVQQTLHRLRHHPAPFIAIFTHGLFIRLLLWAALTNNSEASSQAQRQFHRFLNSLRVPNAGICIAHIHADGHLLFSNFKTDHLLSMSE